MNTESTHFRLGIFLVLNLAPRVSCYWSDFVIASLRLESQNQKRKTIFEIMMYYNNILLFIDYIDLKEKKETSDREMATRLRNENFFLIFEFFVELCQILLIILTYAKIFIDKFLIRYRQLTLIK